MKKNLLFLISAILLICDLPAQGLRLYGLVNSAPGTGAFELVQVNPFTADTTSLYLIDQSRSIGVGSSTYDHQNRRYIFWGGDQQGNKRYFAAAVDSASYLAPTVQGRPPIELQYDLQEDVTYGLLWDENTSTEYLVKVDLQTGMPYDSLMLPGVQAISLFSSGLNSNLHRYVFVGYDSNWTKRLYYINTQTGQIIVQPALPRGQYYRALQFDLNTNTLYGMLSKNDSSVTQVVANQTRYLNETFLVTVDTLTGQYTLVDSVPILSGFQTGIAGGSIDFDQLSRTFILVAQDDTSDFRLMLINVDSAQVYSDVPFPNFVYELECDNQVFARRAYRENTTDLPITEAEAQPLQLFPNPSSGQLEVSLPISTGAQRLRVIDATGREVFQQKLLQTETRKQLDLSFLPGGVYHIVVQEQNGRKWDASIMLTE